jgi:phosphoribosyl 1,2-cyclic phosphate phosphodiesterase
MLRYGVTRIDGVLYTHHHFDHIGGFDDLRQYNFLQKSAMHLYAQEETLEEIRITFRYAFGAARQIGGGLPNAHLHPVFGEQLFPVGSVSILPVPVLHGVLPIFGYRIGNIAYITDTNDIPASSLRLLEGLDVLVLDALRHHTHPTHFSLQEAIDTAQQIGAKRTFFTHIAHNIMHQRDSALLPPEMDFSYDGMIVNSPMETS